MSNPNPIVTANINVSPRTTMARDRYNNPSNVIITNSPQKCSISRSYVSDYLYHNHDVISIRLGQVPKNLIKVNIAIGAQPVATVYHKDIEPDQNLLEKFMYDPSECLPISKCSCMKLWLEFVYDKDLTDLDSSSYYYETEEITRRVLSEEDVTIYNEDEGCCMTGKRVLDYKVDKIQIIHFVLPKITVESREAYYPEDVDKDTKEKACVRVWEKITINRSQFTEELLEKYIQNYELCTDDGGNIIEMYRALSDKEMFEAKLVNQIRFAQGMAGLSHRF